MDLNLVKTEDYNFSDPAIYTNTVFGEWKYVRTNRPVYVVNENKEKSEIALLPGSDSVRRTRADIITSQ